MDKGAVKKSYMYSTHLVLRNRFCNWYRKYGVNHSFQRNISINVFILPSLREDNCSPGSIQNVLSHMPVAFQCVLNVTFLHVIPLMIPSLLLTKSCSSSVTTIMRQDSLIQGRPIIYALFGWKVPFSWEESTIVYVMWYCGRCSTSLDAARRPKYV